MVQNPPNCEDDNGGKQEWDGERNQICFLRSPDSRDDWCATFWASDRIVAHLISAFVTIDESHN
jgi:hypothetical protein